MSQGRAGSSTFQAMLAQKKKKLDALLLSPSDLAPEQVSLQPLVAAKNQIYLASLNQLQDLRHQTLSATQALSSLSLQIQFAQRQQSKLGQMLLEAQRKRHRASQQQRIHNEQRIKQQQQSFNQRISSNVNYLEKLLKEKEELISMIQKQLVKRKQIESKTKEALQKHPEEVVAAKTDALQIQKVRKQKWEQSKTQQIMALTLKGIEPQIQRIVAAGQTEIKRLQEDALLRQEQFLQSKKIQYAAKFTTLKNQLHENFQAEKQNLMKEYATKLKQQFQSLETEYEQDRIKIRAQRDAEIKQLERKRKQQAEEFMWKDKQQYSAYSKQIKKIQVVYDKQFLSARQGLEEQVESMIKPIQQKHVQELAKYQQLKTKNLAKMIQVHHAKCEEDLALKAQQLASQTAIENQRFQATQRINFQEKLKKLRESNPEKEYQKTLQNAMNKLQVLENTQRQLQARVVVPAAQIDQLKRQNVFIETQIIEWQRKILQNKVWAPESQPCSVTPQIQSVKQQINELKQSLAAQEHIMAGKTKEMCCQYEKLIEELEKGALKLSTVRDQEILRLKTERESLLKVGKALQQMRAKQKAMLSQANKY